MSVNKQSYFISDLIEEFESDSEPFLPQQFGLIEDPGVIRINNVDYGDVLDVDYGEIISFKQSKSFIDNLHHHTRLHDTDQEHKRPKN